jgi:hypothetical protein
VIVARKRLPSIQEEAAGYRPGVIDDSFVEIGSPFDYEDWELRGEPEPTVRPATANGHVKAALKKAPAGRSNAGSG